MIPQTFQPDLYPTLTTGCQVSTLGIHALTLPQPSSKTAVDLCRREGSAVANQQREKPRWNPLASRLNVAASPLLVHAEVGG